MKGGSQCEGATLSEPAREGWGLSALLAKGLSELLTRGLALRTQGIWREGAGQRRDCAFEGSLVPRGAGLTVLFDIGGNAAWQTLSNANELKLAGLTRRRRG